MAEHKIERTHVALKSGMGTVAKEDYDEKLHGKALEENDDQYKARVYGRFQGVLPGPNYPPTSIPNLQSFVPEAVVTPIVPVLANQLSNARPVVTTADVKDGKLELGDDSPKMQRHHEAEKAKGGSVAGASQAQQAPGQKAANPGVTGPR